MNQQWSYVVFFLTSVVGFQGKPAMSETLKLKLRSIEPDHNAAQGLQRTEKEVEWDLSQTAIIVCDVWDLHHCLNAVKRLEEFAPRLDQVLNVARRRGAVVIHAPSDCMPAYADHPARKRAINIQKADPMPSDIEHWCSRLEGENSYPIDQSDGGEDDEPTAHAAWVETLTRMGRIAGTPWMKQSSLITIDSERDFITDRGDEAWSILEQQGVKNVILTGVHCNMCVLGRPFGLRQMVRNKKHVVLMRDMTDSMYSPKRWPYVDHFVGNDLVIEHVEQFVCPTITSDQFLGGAPFRWAADKRESSGDLLLRLQVQLDLTKQWTTVDVHHPAVIDARNKGTTSVWYRGALRIPEKWQQDGPLGLGLPANDRYQVWLNGKELHASPPAPDRAWSGRLSASDGKRHRR